jgi:D-3-phosphoglycerate dehydrogenase
MWKILANDGLSSEGEKILRDAGFFLSTEKVPQDKLIEEINRVGYDGIIVRSATRIDRTIIDACTSLKLIGRAGVGMDYIDMEYAVSKGIELINTPDSSAPSVAEIAIAHLMSLQRNLFTSNRQLPTNSDFAELKRRLSCGHELTGKTLGILGFGKVGQEVAKRALGLGMNILPYDPYVTEANIMLDIPGVHNIAVLTRTFTLDKVFEGSDFISVHVPLPADKKPVITLNEIKKMKKGVVIISVSKGGVICEADLLTALNEGLVSYAGLDVYATEPEPDKALLKHDRVSLTPHIGGSTVEAQARIGIDLANKIIKLFNHFNHP